MWIVKFLCSLTAPSTKPAKNKNKLVKTTTGFHNWDLEAVLEVINGCVYEDRGFILSAISNEVFMSLEEKEYEVKTQ